MNTDDTVDGRSGAGFIAADAAADDMTGPAIERAWHAFTHEGTDPHLSPAVRPEIADSWVRSRAFGLDPHNRVLSSPVTTEEFDKILDIYEPLIEITRPMIGIVDDLGITNDYIFELVARNGASLLRVGNLDLHPFVKERDIFSEATMGTNAHSLCMRHKEPFQVVGHEHYSEALHCLAADAAPIRGEDDVVIAALLLTQPLPEDPWSPAYHKLLMHALGLITSVCSAIEYQMSFIHLSADLQNMGKEYARTTAQSAKMRRMLDTTIDTSSDPVMIVDTQGVVQKISPEAARIIGRGPVDVVDTTVDALFDVNWQQSFGALLDGTKKTASAKTSIRGRTFMLRGTSIQGTKGDALEGVLVRLEERTRGKEPSARAVGERASITFKDILGESPQIAQAIALARRYAVTAENILIIGESGTGKELFAQAIHNESRPDGPFMSINCAAIPPRLIESELFGYESGAFTGAERGGKAGKIELANGGTLFLDEIGDMPLELQATLLRVLENKRVMRLGGKIYKQVDFRVVAATNRDLGTMVREGTFREDLLYRLAILTVELPPLRARQGDALYFAKYFLNECRCKSPGGPRDITPGAQRLFENYRWLGNVRQIKNAVYSMYYAVEGDVIDVDDFSTYILRAFDYVPGDEPDDEADPTSPASVPAGGDASDASTPAVPAEGRAAGGPAVALEPTPEEVLGAIEASSGALSLAEAELAAIRLAMRIAHNNVKEASTLLGISKATLYRKLKEYGIE